MASLCLSSVNVTMRDRPYARGHGGRNAFPGGLERHGGGSLVRRKFRVGREERTCGRGIGGMLGVFSALSGK